VGLGIRREDANGRGLGAPAVGELERRDHEAVQVVRVDLLEILVAQPPGERTPEGLDRVGAFPTLPRDAGKDVCDLGMDLSGLNRRGVFDRVRHGRSAAFRQ
jgi:hypothetical protein